LNDHLIVGFTGSRVNARARDKRFEHGDAKERQSVDRSPRRRPSRAPKGGEVQRGAGIDVRL
jgi:hypothetical protein